MKDPERLLRRPPSELTGALLRAGRDEKPSASSLRRALRVAAVGGAAIGATLHTASAGAAAIGAKSGLAGFAGGGAAANATAAAATAATAATAAGITAASAGVAATAGAAAAGGGTIATITAVAIAKWVGVGAIGGVVAATAAHRLAPSVYEPIAAPQTVKAAAAPARALRPSKVGVRGAFAGERTRRDEAVAALEAPAAEDAKPPEAPLSSDRLGTTAEPAVAAAAAPLNNAASRITANTPRERTPALETDPNAAAAQPVLAAEVAFVDRGRAAVQRGDSAGALQLLAGYEAAFPKQQLLPEVQFLRMEALTLAGDRERARALARRIVARGAAGPQAARAQELLSR